jgi:hypothetical protein
MGASLARLGNQLEPGQFIEQLARDLGALANQDDDIRVAQSDELTHALDGVGIDLCVEGIEQLGAIELANRVLVIVQDNDVHHWHP